MRSLARWLICLLTALAPAQGDAPAALIAQLSGDPKTTVHQQLVALGGRAVPALLDALAANKQPRASEMLQILREIGQDAGSAVPTLIATLQQFKVENSNEVLWTLAELAPFRDASVQLDAQWLYRTMLGNKSWLGLVDEAEMELAFQRLRVRLAFPIDASVEVLTDALRGFQAYRVELAVEWLGRRGPAAHSALSELPLLLERPDPRVLTTDRTVPLRAKTARAILAIAGDGPAANRARAVLAGAPPLPTAEPRIPDRTRTRIAELILQLGHEATGEAAAANLKALGRLAASAIVDALREPHDAAFQHAAVAVLESLGPEAAGVVPRLLDMLFELPAGHAPVMLDARTATAPWCRDVLPVPSCNLSLRRITVFECMIPGDPDAEILTAFGQAIDRLMAAMAVDPASSPPELEQLLASEAALTRERALVVLCGRRDGARASLPVIAAMLDAQQPRRSVTTCANDGSVRVEARDHTESIHRLAAQAILAIAAPDDPLVAMARQVLAGLERK